MIRGYCDFNISPPKPSVATIKTLCQSALDAGYGTVAVTTRLDEAVFESRKKKKKDSADRPEGDLIPAPLQLDDLKKEFENKLQILQRLTVPLSDNLQVHKMTQSKNLQLYDILAVLPLTQAVLQSACATMEIDLITYDPNNTGRCRLVRKLVRQAAERGVHFELQYSPCVMDSGARVSTISLAHNLHALGRAAACIVVSSGAQHQDHIRSPYDVVNLGLLLGLSEEKAKGALTHSCRSLLLRATARRKGKAVVSACPVTLLKKGEDDWRLQHANTKQDFMPPAKRQRGPDKA